MGSPILKHHMSLKHPLSSQPPNIHATLSARVTVCARKPWVGSAPQTGALLQYITGGGAGSTSCIFGRRGTARKRAGGGWSGPGVRGDLATASRGVAESDVELALGVGRRRVVVVLVGESPGVERRDVDCARGVREEELVTRSVDVEAEREELEPLGYGKGKDSDRAAWTGLSADTGGVRGRSSPSGRDMVRRGAGELPCVDMACRPASFDTERGC
jgi:hypothetical protein